MDFFIVPKPILTKSNSLMAYCLRYLKLDNNVPDPSNSEDCGLEFLSLVEELGIETLSGGAPLFVPLSKACLRIGAPTTSTLQPKKIIFLIDRDTPPTEPYLSNMKALIDKGYTFAMENPEDIEAVRPVASLCNYILLRYNGDCKETQDLHMEMEKVFKDHVFVASNVNNIDAYDTIVSQGYYFYEGALCTRPLLKDKGTMSPVKANRVQILTAVQQPDFDMDEITKIVSRDPYMTISLLDLVNSPYIGLRQEVTSISQAMALLGQKEVRKWVLTVLVRLLAEDKPSELVRLALFRAKFSENLAKPFGLATMSSTFFLVGLFSVLDAVLGIPMQEALDQVKVAEDVKEALVSRTGRLSVIYNLVFAYECADWATVENMIDQNRVQTADVLEAYLEASRWYSSLLKGVY